MSASGRRYWIASGALLAATALILLWMGRPPIAASGRILLWIGEVQSADNSQHIGDWYVPSHIIHGFLFYWMGWLLFRRGPLGERYVMALAVEAAWEIVENSQWIIDRYREATMALGYNGDSVLNSLCDIGWMSLGFWLARRLPVWATVMLAILFELLTLVLIRDNLTLNVLMLVAPIDIVRDWQAAA